MKTKIALGTVQFGANYGINNTSGIPSGEEIEAIFNLAADNGINTFDTAIAYGNAEERIGPLLKEGASVISKFVRSENNFSEELGKSLSRLGLNCMYAFLAHNADEFLIHPGIWEQLAEFKSEKRILKRGYSLYHPEQLDRLLDSGFIPDIVQIPYSLLDRRFEPDFARLKKMGVEIHVRSVFLQGLYFMKTKDIPSKLSPLKPELSRLREIIDDNKIDMQELALNFAMKNIFIDKVVIGVDSAEQLLQNINALESWNERKNVIFNEVLELQVTDTNLLIPSKWI